MHVVVLEHYQSDNRRDFVGPDLDVATQLVATYPHLAATASPGAPVATLVQALNRLQGYTAAESPDVALPPLDRPIEPQIGRTVAYEACLAAARFLVPGSEPLDVDARRAFLEAEGDPERAALAAYHLDESMLPALRSVVGWATQVTQGLAKTEPTPDVREVRALEPEGAAYAEAVSRAFRAKAVQTAHLGGVHSKGTLIAQDPETHVTYILKHGTGGEGVAAAAEVHTSEGKREAISWAALKLWGLDGAAPECHLVQVDGIEYAALRMLPRDFRGLDEALKEDPALPRRLLRLYWSQLHRWAVADYVLGNVDRHAGNLMYRGDQVQLIDFGSALAGPDFAPGVDLKTFVPFYLRCFAPGDFLQHPPRDRAWMLPRVAPALEAELRGWIQNLPHEPLATLLQRYGVDPAPELQRLTRLQTMCQSMPADLVVNSVWVGL